jgi:hypothetical protein
MKVADYLLAVAIAAGLLLAILQPFGAICK